MEPIIEVRCCECGERIFFETGKKNVLVNSHASFWCTACGTKQSFTGETEAQRYKRLYESEQQMRNLESDEHRRQLNRVKKKRT